MIAVIPTVPARVDALDETVRQLRNHAHWVLPYVSMTTGDSRLDVGAAVRRAALRPGMWWLYLEDDVDLGPEFAWVARVLWGYGSIRHLGAISFFTLKDGPDGLAYAPRNMLYSSCCVALRPADPDEFDEFAAAWYRKHPQHHHASDLLLGAWVRHRGQKIATVTPSLVQHRQLPSTLGKRSKSRRSASYDRAYGGHV